MTFPHVLTATALACTIALPLAAQQTSYEVEVHTADGTPAGIVSFDEMPDGVLIRARLENLPEGAHGFHIHENGTCAPDFGAAGGHYTPAGVAHGYDNATGYHAGDLPNVYVQADGTAEADFFATWLTLEGSPKDAGPFPLNDASGSAIMIHAEGDDYEADPAGSTGARIACGVVAPNRV